MVFNTMLYYLLIISIVAYFLGHLYIITCLADDDSSRFEMASKICECGKKLVCCATGTATRHSSNFWQFWMCDIHVVLLQPNGP